MKEYTCVDFVFFVYFLCGQESSLLLVSPLLSVISFAHYLPPRHHHVEFIEEEVYREHRKLKGDSNDDDDHDDGADTKRDEEEPNGGGRVEAKGRRVTMEERAGKLGRTCDGRTGINLILFLFFLFSLCVCVLLCVRSR